MLTLGLDFGTSTSKAAWWDERTAQVTMMSLGRDDPFAVPSAVYASTDGNLLFGDEAVDELPGDPVGFLTDLKRRLARADAITLRDHQYAPADLVRRFFAALRAQVAAQPIPRAIERTVVAVPTALAEDGQALLCQAATQAGFPRVEALAEPLAVVAAFRQAYSDRVLGQYVLVLNWGGGFRDLALVEVRGGELLLLPPAPADQAALGGYDLDGLFLAAIEQRLQAEGIPVFAGPSDPRRQVVLREIEEQKRRLSIYDESSFSVLDRDRAPRRVVLTRQWFEDVIRERVMDMARALDGLLRRAKAEGRAPTQLLVTGGSTRIPLVDRVIREHLGLDILAWDRDDNPVAFGAARYDRRAPASAATAPATPLTLRGRGLRHLTAGEFGVAARCFLRAAHDAAEGNASVLEPQSGLAPAEAVAGARQAAEQGNAEAAVCLAAAALVGLGVPGDQAGARECFARVAARGQALGEVACGLACLHGWGTAADPAGAAAWFRQAAQREDADGRFFLGLMYRGGRGLPHDEAQALTCFRQAAEQGHAGATAALGHALVAVDEAQALTCFRRAAEAGEANGLYGLGQMLFDGRGAARHERDAVAAIRQAAEQGHAQAELWLALAYTDGRGVVASTPRALEWLRKAAQQGLAEAQYRLGTVYRDGWGVPKDESLAREWFRRAAEQGHPGGQTWLGLSLTQGEGVPHDEAQALEWFRKAADQGYAEAQYCLGSMLDAGRGMPRDLAQALTWYRKAADQQQPYALMALGTAYLDGIGVTPDERQALVFYQRAAELAHLPAYACLGMMYRDGRGVPQDDQEAVNWYRLGAEHGDPKCEYCLGYMYEEGRGVRVTPANQQRQAAEWYAKAAAHGVVPAMVALADLYVDGRGVPRDHRRAAELCRQAAEYGDPQAQYGFGRMCAEGLGVACDQAAAQWWLTKAAEQGYVMAQEELGARYAAGRVVAASREQAIYWFRQAAAMGLPTAQCGLARALQAAGATREEQAEAVTWMRRAADNHYADGQFLLGRAYQQGAGGLPADPDLAKKWLTLAAKQGHHEAQALLAGKPRRWGCLPLLLAVAVAVWQWWR